MNFDKATEILMAGMTRAEIGKALGKSEATVRQAKLAPSANAYRTPPPGWEAVLAGLARKRADSLKKLADRLDP